MNNNLPPILCADDNPYDVELFLIAFEEIELKHPVSIVRDGQEALDYLNYRGDYSNRPVHKPAAILLDIKMPKISGIDVLRAIREKEEWQEIPVIMMTSSKMKEDIDICYQLGANAYVVKPIEFDQFVKMVRSLSQFWSLLDTGRN